MHNVFGNTVCGQYVRTRFIQGMRSQWVYATVKRCFVVIFFCLDIAILLFLSTKTSCVRSIALETQSRSCNFKSFSLHASDVQQLHLKTENKNLSVVYLLIAAITKK